MTAFLFAGFFYACGSGVGGNDNGSGGNVDDDSSGDTVVNVLQKRLASDAESYDQFGYSVAIRVHEKITLQSLVLNSQQLID